MKSLFLSTLSATIAICLFALLGFSEKKEKGLNMLEAPVGSIVVWPGPESTRPNGWLLCNGNKISRSMYPKLCDVILNYWGPISGLNNDIHTLPDLQGVFLRGANYARTGNFSDPDREGRVPSGNGKSNEVGSFQDDEMLKHHHKLFTLEDGDPNHIGFSGDEKSFAAVKAYSGHGAAIGYNIIASTTKKNPSIHKSNEAGGGKETRPVNAYVNFIIRAN